MFLKKYIRVLKEALKILRISIRNTINNLKYLSISNNRSKNYLENQILLLVHSIEKGLCLKDIRYGFGKAKTEQLMKLLLLYNNLGYNINDYAFKEGIGVLDGYIKFHKNNNYNVDYLEEKVKSFKKNIKLDKLYDEFAGVRAYTANELEQGKMFDFNAFIMSRHSIRNFSKEQVNKEIIERAIEIAQRSPSACNRQPSKVYYSLSKEINSKIDSIIPGNQGFSGYVDKYLVITCDMLAFGSIEVNQWYINGGIYSSFLLLALHSMGIGTCIFQWADIKEKDTKLRKIAGIPDNEKIILVIGIGHYPDMPIKTPIALRKSVDDVKRIF